VDLVVNATPVGMTIEDAGAQSTGPTPAGDPGDPAPRVDPGLLGPGQVLVDLVYHPPTTRLIDEARQRGVTAVNGMGMLVQQAALAFELWTGEDAPRSAMRAAVAEAVGATRQDRA
jgi:shikimate dehydrogenase